LAFPVFLTVATRKTHTTSPALLVHGFHGSFGFRSCRDSHDNSHD
jgi:hypothetical protein